MRARTYQVEMLPKLVSGTMVPKPADRAVYVQVFTLLVVLRQYYHAIFLARPKYLRIIMV